MRILVASTSSTPDLRTTYLYPTHLRLDALLFGVLLRYYREFQPAKFRELATSRSGLVIMAVALSLLAMMPNKATAMHTFGFTCVYFGAGLLLARAVDYQPHPYTAAWIVRPLALIGYYSYSIYLWHGWALRLLPHDTALSFWGCLLVSIALGIVMAKLIEYPMLALRERLVPARRHSTPSDFAYAHEETGVGA